MNYETFGNTKVVMSITKMAVLENHTPPNANSKKNTEDTRMEFLIRCVLIVS